MPKVLFQLYIEVAQFNYIKKEAEKREISRAALVREMIQAQKKEMKKKERDANV